MCDPSLRLMHLVVIKFETVSSNSFCIQKLEPVSSNNIK